MLRSKVFLLPLLLLTFGCGKVVDEAHAEERAPAKRAPAPSAKPAGAEHAPDRGGPRYGVPFAWEVSKEEPLAKARAYLTEMLADNAVNAGQGRTHFAPFAETQSPRATVVTCADSRVQANAWDETPENDAFTIRNIGNQVTNAHGSVEYGLEHLHTPVLLVLGHTGCGAVKAAMGSLDGLSDPIKNELKGLKLPDAPKGVPERKAWAEAVVTNVNQQVAFAVANFGTLLREQRVSVVGAVYDFRNDLGKGFGKISIVNVNGNTEPERLRAFQTALNGAQAASRPDETPFLGSKRGERSPEADIVDLLNDKAGPKPRLRIDQTAPEAHGDAHGAEGHEAKSAPPKPRAPSPRAASHGH
ncbi:MAG TPA: carbonic anhydrase [Polyangiaceae bacterium]